MGAVVLGQPAVCLSNRRLCAMIAPVACPETGFPLPAIGPGAIPWKGGDRPVRSYELVFIVHPEVDGDDLTAVIDTVSGLVERAKGKVVRIDPWGVRRLAYPVQNQWEGQYVLMRLDVGPQGVTEIERGLGLSEQIMRHLVVRVEGEGEEPVTQSEKDSDASE